MCSTGGDAALPAPGFPIRVSAGQRLFSASPRLIAAVHALHRLLVPRHPPCALNILTLIRPGRARSGDTHTAAPASEQDVPQTSAAGDSVQFSRTAERT